MLPRLLKVLRAATKGILIRSTAAFLLVPGPALAQQVLICGTLHNDLANFDRRAHFVDPYSKTAFETALVAYQQAYYNWQSACETHGGPTFVGPDCDALNRETVREEAEYYRIQWLYSDPIRRRIVAELARNWCPIDPVPPP